jgi:hypothetical protein
MTYNPARDGLTVKAMAEIFAMYAKNNPDAIVKVFPNNGKWPEGNTKMGVFTDHQIAMVDNTRVGGSLHLAVWLLPK